MTKYSLIRRSGNKNQNNLVSKIVPYLPSVNLTGGFYDLFCGTGVVSFEYMKQYPNIKKAIFLNDIDDKLITFFEYLQHHTSELEKALEWRWVGSERVCDEPIVKWYLDNQLTTHLTRTVQLVKHFQEFDYGSLSQL